MGRRWLSVGLSMAIVGGLVMTLTGVRLADTYRPNSSGSVDVLHNAGLVALGLGLAIAVGGAVRALPSAEVSVRRRLAVAVALGLGILAGLAGWLTGPLVAWDNLAVRSVTVVGDVSGWWSAAYGDDLAFVLVGGSEVSPSEYASAMWVHLLAPVVATLSAAGALVASGLSGRGGAGQSGPAATSDTAASA